MKLRRIFVLAMAFLLVAGGMVFLACPAEATSAPPAMTLSPPSQTPDPALPSQTPPAIVDSEADDPNDDTVFPFSLFTGGEDVEGATTTMEIVVLLTILSLAPSILIMLTAFTRIVIVFSFVRNAMGTQQMPPNQVLVGLALFLTFFVMQPIFAEINETAIKPYEAEEITQAEMLENAMVPLREFMFTQIRAQGNEESLRTFMGIAEMEMPNSLEDIPSHVLIPAFIISEIKVAFKIGFILYIPFIVIDMVVASALMSMGMMMLPPTMISMPFKIMLFILVDGWGLLVTTLLGTFT
ncbi:flagellar type III secretion system pore protein FliP [Oscillospiraceae bacterium OttesenSCG-928-F05]|nr:flagellar type III secretion system pore protein FliP [Oscillospiraceae bacterium OttesenSCG-928-F05]